MHLYTQLSTFYVRICLCVNMCIHGMYIHVHSCVCRSVPGVCTHTCVRLCMYDICVAAQLLNVGIHEHVRTQAVCLDCMSLCVRKAGELSYVTGSSVLASSPRWDPGDPVPPSHLLSGGKGSSGLDPGRCCAHCSLPGAPLSLLGCPRSSVSVTHEGG